MRAFRVGHVHMITTHATPKPRVIANTRHRQQALLGDLQGKDRTMWPGLEIAVVVPTRKQRLRPPASRSFSRARNGQAGAKLRPVMIMQVQHVPMSAPHSVLDARLIDLLTVAASVVSSSSWPTNVYQARMVVFTVANRCSGISLDISLVSQDRLSFPPLQRGLKSNMSKPSARRDNLKSPAKNAMNPRPYSSNASITHDVTSEISKATPRSMTGSCLSPTSQPRLGYLCRGCAHIHIMQMTFQPER